VRENNNVTGATKNNHDMAEGQAAGPDTQNMDCEPFEASNGPSDDDTAVEQEQQKDNPVPTAKKTMRSKQQSASAIRKSARIRHTTRRF
jgi:ribosomal protein S12